jgi:hypothetical protein
MPLIVLTSHRGAHEKCQASIEATGFDVVEVKGVPDIALARCVAFAAALDRADEYDVALFLDDDMTFAPLDVEHLCEVARIHNVPVSACYVTATGSFAAVAMDAPGETAALSWLDRRWLCGLGCLAVPISLIRSLATTSREVRIPPRLGRASIPEFTYCGAGSLRIGGEVQDLWVSEDYRLIARLGGAVLAPIRAGHIKPVSLLPELEVVERVFLKGS